MSKTFIAMVTSVTYQNAEVPLTSTFEGREADHYRASDFSGLVKAILKDPQARSSEQKRIADDIDAYIRENQDNPELRVLVTCYDADANPIPNAVSRDPTAAISLDDKVKPYIFETTVDSTDYDTIDFMLRPSAMGGYD